MHVSIQREIVKSISYLIPLAVMLAPTDAISQDFTPPKVTTNSPGGVSLSDGSFMMSDVDLSIGPLSFERFHIGGRRDPNSPPFGPRTTHNFSIYTAANSKRRCPSNGGSNSCVVNRRPIVHMGNSASGQYSDVASTSYSQNLVFGNDDESLKGSLSRIGSGVYNYLDQSGTKYEFGTIAPMGGPSNSFRVENITFADGRRQTFLYDSSSRLKVVTDSSGYALAFEYNASNLISVACGYNTGVTFVSVNIGCSTAKLKSSYSYDNGHLSGVVNAAGESKSYTWSVDRITCVSTAKQACQIANTYEDSHGSWMVSQQKMADGAIWKYQYYGRYDGVRDPDIYADATATSTTDMTDPAGNVSRYNFMETSPVSIVDANSNETKYLFEGGKSYDSPAEYPTNFGSTLKSVTLPRGNKIAIEYSGPWRTVSKRVLTGTDGKTLTKSYGYDFSSNCSTSPQTCAKPIWEKDANSAQTDYTYTSFGSVDSELQPAPTPGELRRLTKYTYVQKYAYVQNGAGGVVPAASPIWMKDSETVCQAEKDSRPARCDSKSPQFTTKYEYGPDGVGGNLLVRGIAITADGQTRRTCFGYDYAGNRVSETKPRAGLGGCL
jgi:hypothetical protein